MAVYVLGNGKIKVRIQCSEQRRDLYQRFFAFISPNFLPEADDGDIDLCLNLETETAFTNDYKALCTTEQTIRISSAEAFNLTLKRGELPDGTQLAWNERDTTGYAFAHGSKIMTMYVSNNSFIHLIEFFRYYLLLIEASKGTMLLHASALENVESGKVVAICGVKGAGKTSTMLNLSCSKQYQYFSGDKLLVDTYEGKLRVRGWPDYPHVGVGSLRQHPELCQRIGIVPSEPPMSQASDRDKYLFTPELFYGALGKPLSQISSLEAIVLPDVLAENISISCLNHAEKQAIDENHMFENPYDFMTATWHGLHAPKLTPSIIAEHQKIKQALQASTWLKLTGNVDAGQIAHFLGQKDNQLKIALVAPSGSGKSTVAELLKKSIEKQGLSVSVEKLGEPLYELQSAYFSVLKQNNRGESQHQKLLEHIADNLRMLNPNALVAHLFSRLNANKNQVVITDDLRDITTDWPALIGEGYVCLRVQCDEVIRHARLNQRNDLQAELNSKLDTEINAIETQHIIVNNGSLDELASKVEHWVAQFLETRNEN